MSKVTSAENYAGHRAKWELDVRSIVEDMLKSGTDPVPDERIKRSKAMKQAFNKFKKLHSSLSESDSRSLNQLIWATFQQNMLKDLLENMSPDDELYDKVFNRMDKLEKQIDKLEDKLHIALKYRLNQAQSISKAIIEAMKAQEFENEESEKDDELDSIIEKSVEEGA